MATLPDSTSEQARLEAVAGRYDPSDPTAEFDFHLKRLQARAVRSWLLGDRVLEMGCATGELTSLLIDAARDYHVVEGSEQNVAATRARVPDATFHRALWEDFQPVAPFSDVVLVCALEHCQDAVQVLQLARGWLRPGGRVHVVVPNADSLHRHVGVAMGILSKTTDLSHSDHRIGHRRVYTVETLLADVRAAGLTTLHWQGLFLKVLSNQQMLGWDPALINALDEVARRLPSYGAELFVVATA